MLQPIADEMKPVIPEVADVEEGALTRDGEVVLCREAAQRIAMA